MSPIIGYIEEALFSDISLWACCPTGTGACSTLNAAEARGQVTSQRIIPHQSNFQFLHRILSRPCPEGLQLPLKQAAD